MSPMNNRLLRPTSNYDADALRYINAVQVADGQALEPEVRTAIDAFARGCKADGIWDAIKASCILCGARTLTGALVPLVGDAPTPYNFASADYSRTTGLKGDGSTTYLDSNRANNADGQDDNHNAVYVSQAATALSGYLCSASGVSGANQIFPDVSLNTLNFRNRRSFGIGSTLSGYAAATGLMGHSRKSSSEYSIRASGLDFSATLDSQTTDSNNLTVFKFGAAGFFSDARIAFYSIGSAISDLSLLDTRVSTLISAIAAALS